MPVSDISSLMTGALSSGKSDTATEEKPPPTALEMETDFKKRYKSHTGSDVFEQYVPVNFGTAEKPKWQKSLVYKMQDENGQEYNYVPAIHGPEHAFQSNDHITQIPSVDHANPSVNTVRNFLPGGQQGLVQPSQPVDLGQSNPMVNPGVVDAAVQGLNAGAAPGLPQQEIPQGVVDSAVDSMQVGAPSAIPGTPFDPGGWATDPETGEKVFTPDNGTGDYAPIPGQTAPAEAPPTIPLDKDGNPDYTAAVINLINQHKPGQSIDEANKIRIKAAAQAREIVNPKIGGPGMWALGAAALLGGRHGGEVLAGGLKGIQGATQTRQAQADAAWSAKQAEASMQAKALEDQGKAEEDGFKLKLQTLLGLNKTEADKYYKEAQLNLKKEGLRQSNQRILGKADADLWSGLSKQKGPEERRLFAISHGIDEQDAERLAALRPAEQLAMANASFRAQKEKSDAEMLPYRQKLDEARTQGMYASTGLTVLRSEGQQWTNDFLKEKSEYYPKLMTAELAQKAASTARDLNAADELTRRHQNGGLTDNEYINQLGKFGKLSNKAEEQFKIYDSLATKQKASLDSLDKKIGETEKAIKDANDPKNGELINMKKARLQLQNQVDKSQAMAEGYKVSKEGYASTEAKIEAFKKTAPAAGTGAWKVQPNPAQIQELINAQANPALKAKAEASFAAHFGRLP